MRLPSSLVRSRDGAAARGRRGPEAATAVFHAAGRDRRERARPAPRAARRHRGRRASRRARRAAHCAGSSAPGLSAPARRLQEARGVRRLGARGSLGEGPRAAARAAGARRPTRSSTSSPSTRQTRCALPAPRTTWGIAGTPEARTSSPRRSTSRQAEEDLERLERGGVAVVDVRVAIVCTRAPERGGGARLDAASTSTSTPWSGSPRWRTRATTRAR